MLRANNPLADIGLKGDVRSPTEDSTMTANNMEGTVPLPYSFVGKAMTMPNKIMTLLLCGILTVGVLYQTTASFATSPHYYQCLSKLPKWTRQNSVDLFSQEMVAGSKGLTDKTKGGQHGHDYQFMYHRYMSPLAQRTCEEDRNNKIRIMEIGLGCDPSGGMIDGKPGGSAFAWRYMFPSPAFDLDLHIMEFDADCAIKWAEENPGIAHIHTGDASDAASLNRVVEESGGDLFDIIVDDGSHMNSHQIIVMDTLINHVAPGGTMFIEDIHSSCRGWKANTGAVSQGLWVGGTEGCMVTATGEPTIYAHVVDWQKKLILRMDPAPGVKHIDICYEAVALQK